MSLHHDPDQLRAVAIAGARAAGCTCHPDIEVTEEDGGMYRAQVLHDGWCVLMHRQPARWN